MCGIVCGIKKPVLLYEDGVYLNNELSEEIAEGLRRVQYRGYDSWGIGLFGHNYSIRRSLDKEIAAPENSAANYIGLGHTRWATHGETSVRNTHPISSHWKDVYVVHNGIVRNYQLLRKSLIEKGLKFSTDTDTEVIANLIQWYTLDETLSERELLNSIALDLKGESSFVFYWRYNKDRLYFMNLGQPLYIAPGFAVSDQDSFPAYVTEACTTKKGDFGYITPDDAVLLNADGGYARTRVVRSKHVDVEGSRMLSEIKEQANCKTYSDVTLGRLHFRPNNILMYGCGSSYYAGMFGKYLLGNIARMPTRVEYASELGQLGMQVPADTHIIGISQSGETKDTISFARQINEAGVLPHAVITNNPESTLAKLAKTVYNIDVGKEIAVASTKTFLGTCLFLKNMACNYAGQIIKDHDELISNIRFAINSDTTRLADFISEYNNVLLLGAGYNYPIVLEGALKLKEVAYVHAEGMLGSEIKHGPIALIDGQTATIVVNNLENRAILDNMSEIKARGGKIVSICETDDTEMMRLSDYIISLPHTSDVNFALSASVVLQMLAYELAVLKGYNPDMPRNLAKSVTV